jgi:hypothetical protein
VQHTAQAAARRRTPCPCIPHRHVAPACKRHAERTPCAQRVCLLAARNARPAECKADSHSCLNMTVTGPSQDDAAGESLKDNCR